MLRPEQIAALDASEVHILHTALMLFRAFVDGASETLLDTVDNAELDLMIHTTTSYFDDLYPLAVFQPTEVPKYDAETDEFVYKGLGWGRTHMEAYEDWQRWNSFDVSAFSEFSGLSGLLHDCNKVPDLPC